MIQDRKQLNPLSFFASIVLLSVLFFIYLSLRPVPADPAAYNYLANLRSITESGSFFGIEEPFSLLFLYFWKSIFGLNYLTAFQSLASILFGLSLHLILLLFRKGEWTLNHYFLVYTAAFLPFSHEFPVVYFNELVGLLFLLLLFHTFRMETFLDLLLFPLLVVAAFFADFQMFLLGFSIFVLIYSFKAEQKMKSRTTVFYKRKNVPMIILFVYFGTLVLFLILASWNDFFSSSSFYSLLMGWGTIILHLLPALAILVLGNVLLGTEKELRTITFTVILVACTFGVVVFNYSNYNTEIQDQLELEKEGLIRIQPSIQGKYTSYIPSKSANYFYFKTKIPMHYIQSASIPSDSVLFVDNIWQADINKINATYLPRRRRGQPEMVLPLGERSAFIHKTVEDLILKEEENHPLRSRITEAKSNLEPYTPYLRYLEWQIRFIGYTHLQTSL